MSRVRIAGLALGVLGVVLLAIGLVRLVDGSDGASSTPRQPASSIAPSRGLTAALRSTAGAAAPFSGLRSTRIVVGGQTLTVVLARSEAERQQGLRRRRDLGAYDGMLFVFPAPTSVGFTMSTVPVPLDIAFYDGQGAVVSRLRMEPCSGPESQCPVYEASGSFRYALETLAGRLPVGSLD